MPGQLHRPLTPAAPPAPRVVIERHDLDDADTWRRLIAVLAGLIEPQPRRDAR